MNASNPIKNRITPRYVLGAWIVPLAILAVGCVTPLLLRDQLPTSLPLHWGTDGPDRFGSVIDLVWPLAVFGTILILGMGFLGAKLGKEVMTQRILIITNNFLAALFCAISLGTVLATRGLTDTSSMELSNWWIALGTVGGIVLGVLLAWLLKAPQISTASDLPDPTAPRTQLSETEGAVWVAREISVPSLAIGVFAVALVTVAAVVSQLWGLLVLPVALAFLLGTMFVWDFRVDRSGFTAHSALRIFKRHVPFDHIEQANVADTRALVQFGGWGWRTALDGSTGIILRSGESLELLLSDDRRFVVTTSDAASAAGLINTLLERERTHKS